MLDNGTIMGIPLEPPETSKRVPYKSNYATCLSQTSFMPQHCVNGLKSEALSRTQGAAQNVAARSHLDISAEQRLVYKGGSGAALYLGSEHN